jgi:ribosomal protein S18 acetylase RimI-like enzyme
MTENAVTIRRAQTRDAEATLVLLKELAEHEESSQHVHVTQHQWENYLHRQDVIIFVAELEGSPVGYASALRRAHLWSGQDIIALDDLYVQARHRNKRIGERLMRAMADLAGHDGLTIRWEVMPTNVQGQRFYSRLGAKLFTKVIASWSPWQYRPTT